MLAILQHLARSRGAYEPVTWQQVLAKLLHIINTFSEQQGRQVRYICSAAGIVAVPIHPITAQLATLAHTASDASLEHYKAQVASAVSADLRPGTPSQQHSSTLNSQQQSEQAYSESATHAQLQDEASQLWLRAAGGSGHSQACSTISDAQSDHYSDAQIAQASQVDEVRLAIRKF